MNSKVISASDEMMATMTQLRYAVIPASSWPPCWEPSSLCAAVAEGLPAGGLATDRSGGGPGARRTGRPRDRGRAAVEVRQPAASVPNRAGDAMRSRPGATCATTARQPLPGQAQATLPPARHRCTDLGPRRRAGRGRRAGPPDRPRRDHRRRRRRRGLAARGVAADDGLRRAEDLVGRQAVRPLAAGRAARAGEVAALAGAAWRGRKHGVQPRRLQIVTARRCWRTAGRASRSGSATPPAARCGRPSWSGRGGSRSWASSVSAEGRALAGRGGLALRSQAARSPSG